MYIRITPRGEGWTFANGNMMCLVTLLTCHVSYQKGTNHSHRLVEGENPRWAMHGVGYSWQQALARLGTAMDRA
jgi:hypothetical protein